MLEETLFQNAVQDVKLVMLSWYIGQLFCFFRKLTLLCEIWSYFVRGTLHMVKFYTASLMGRNFKEEQVIQF